VLAAASSSSSPAGLQLMVDLSSYQLPQVSSLPPSSHTSPLASSRHPMTLRPRQAKTANLVASAAATSASTRVLHSPSSEPFACSDADRYAVWHNAMCDEIAALRSKRTWSLVPFHPSMNVVGSRWVYRIKCRVDGSIECYKAHLVARGFTKQEGIDYSKTFSPVIKQATIRLVFSIAVSRNWKIHQLDIHNAFLNGVLIEEVYMKQPPSFVDSSLPSHVCRLHKSLYGLKHAPRAWYTHLSDFLLSIGFQASKVDTSLFILSDGTNIFYLPVYVDDILLTGSNSAMLHHLIQLLSSKFKLHDLGVVHYFLGIEVQSTGMGLMLRQHKYILDILTHAGMTSCKPVDTRVSLSKVTILPDNSFSDPTRFRQIVGSLQYLTFTRPDLCFVVNRVCQFMHAPTNSHWAAVKRILCNLKGTTSYGFHITRGSSLTLHGFTDADWAGNIDDRKSMGGYLVFFCQTSISWKSDKQRTVARSSTEAEYKALANGTAEVIWLQYLLTDLQVPLIFAPTIWCDNLGATYLSTNPIFHARTKHVEVDYHFVRDRIAKKEIQICFVPSRD
jgi:histone deacetylase 1/2